MKLLRHYLYSLILVGGFLSPCFAQSSDSIESIEQELTALEIEYSGQTQEDVALEAQQNYVNQLLDLRERLMSLRASEGLTNEDATAGPDDGQANSKGEHILLISSVDTAQPAATNAKAPDIYDITVSTDAPGLSERRERSNPTSGTTKGRLNTQRSTGFEDYPISINLGDPFSYKVSVRAEMENTKKYCLGEMVMNQAALTSIGMADVARSALTRVLYPVYEKLEFKCAKIPDGHYPLLDSVHLSGEHTLEIQCKPASPAKETPYLVSYPYECRYQSSVWGVSDYYPSFSIFWPKVEIEDNGKFLGAHNTEHNGQLVIVNGFGTVRSFNDYQESRIRYMPKFKVRQELQSHSYEHPFPLREKWLHPDDEQFASDENRRQQDSDADSGSGLEDSETDTEVANRDGSASESGLSGDQRGTGRDGEQDGPDNSGAGSVDLSNPASINPDSPNIAALISQWINSSEPAVNVQHGHQFKFEQWGRFVGTNVDGGKISVRRKPDDVGAQSSSRYLWSKRTTLLSANNCSLEEFVMNSLQSLGHADCINRFGPILPDFAGKSIAEAKRKLTALKLEVRQVPGTPAPSKQKSMTVEEQMLSAGTELKQGQTVELKLYLPYVPQVKVPDLLGKSSGDAQSRLKKLGLLSKIQLGAAAPSQKLAGKVASQSLAKGAQTKKGTMLLLTVHGPFSGNTVIPNVVGMAVAKAKQIVEFAGYSVNLRLGQKTSDGQLVNTIEKQLPPAGVKLKKGTKVTLYSYASEQRQSTVGKYLGMDVESAREKVVSEGLNANVVTTEEAPDKASVGLVYKQTPPPGIKLKSGGRVSLHAYGAFYLIVGDYLRQPASQILNALKADGLKVSILQGVPAPNKELEGVVINQSPRRGTKVQSGASVSLTTYSAYQGQVNVPNLAGLSSREAQQQLSALGLTPRINDAGAAPNANLANRVAQIFPRSGSNLAPGSVVTISVYGQTATRAQTPPSGGVGRVSGGANSLAGDWQGKITVIDPETGQIDNEINMRFAITGSGSLTGNVDIHTSRRASLSGGANGQSVQYTALDRYNVQGEDIQTEYRFSGQGNGSKLSGRVEYMTDDIDCILSRGFGSISFDSATRESNKRRACPEVLESLPWEAFRVGPAPSNVNRQELEEQLYRAELFRELLISKQAIDGAGVCGGLRSEAARTKRELLALNQQYQGRATADYREQAERLKQSNQQALGQYYSCFANNLRSYQMLVQARISDYQQHSQAYKDLSQEFGRVANLDQFIIELQRQLR